MTMTDTRLGRIAADWQARSDAGEMPKALYEALAVGSEGAYETKVIRHLAKVSRIVDDDGSIRTFKDFKNDWRYSHSVFGEIHKCQICGQSPIVENCVLVDEARNVEVLVGNKCVHRYIDIVDPITGEILDAEERAEFLKAEAKNAKDHFTKQDWMNRFPTVLSDLTEFEEFMQSNSKLKALHREVSKRMVTHGYPGPKARRQWSSFIKTARSQYEKWIKETELKRKEDIRRSEIERERRERFARQIAKDRESWGHAADDWLKETQNVELNSWEKNQRLKVASKLRSGVELSEGNLRFIAEIKIRVRLDGGEILCDDEDFMLLQRMIGNGGMSAWEESFARSVMGRIAAGSPLTTSQQEIVGKMRLKERGINAI